MRTETGKEVFFRRGARIFNRLEKTTRNDISTRFREKLKKLKQYKSYRCSWTMNLDGC